jgi:hypothetical protein
MVQVPGFRKTSVPQKWRHDNNSMSRLENETKNGSQSKKIKRNRKFLKKIKN